MIKWIKSSDTIKPKHNEIILIKFTTSSDNKSYFGIGIYTDKITGSWDIAIWSPYNPDSKIYKSMFPVNVECWASLPEPSIYNINIEKNNSIKKEVSIDKNIIGFEVLLGRFKYE